ncbi:MAG: hypothetical protein IBJ13_01535 [Sphingopyxis sp.]|nr:hypothetical protein [Sphingopyxis sp.]
MITSLLTLPRLRPGRDAAGAPARACAGVDAARIFRDASAIAFTIGRALRSIAVPAAPEREA